MLTAAIANRPGKEYKKGPDVGTLNQRGVNTVNGPYGSRRATAVFREL
jgi:hypothetical protein